MRKLGYYIASTIDGFIAAPDGTADFFPVDPEMAEDLTTRYPETVPTAVRAAIGLDTANQRFDTVLMGRGTYEAGLATGTASPYRHLRQYVVSSTLASTADPEVELVSGDPLALVRRLKREEGLDIWLCGGGGLAGSLLPEIDELIVKRYPVAVGAGVPLFAGEFAPTRFDPVDTRAFDNGTVVTTYARA
ncbi:dihydrofolate reductase family protein [Actinorugispora endophytica]|uniref:Dihydrofolate reductase n=1 Tax=Actinorugispora endophytica TaxID=1605990 RepID=A0A4V3D7B1_9ACTN|nr:dihydrofolate reductase family protein [Actinorugispora endophytica]TDQ47187.1 dihydrofolate reductase [Actinorugispora endophytica]